MAPPSGSVAWQVSAEISPRKSESGSACAVPITGGMFGGSDTWIEIVRVSVKRVVPLQPNVPPLSERLRVTVKVPGEAGARQTIEAW